MVRPTPFAPTLARSGRLAPIGIIVACVAVELALQGADHGLWGRVLWRPLAYQYGGFWAGLLRNWRPNYALQPYTMFLTYSLLHAGPSHLFGNMAGLAVLGNMAVARTGTVRFLALYALSALGGAVAFAALNHAPAPMIGASGAVFGVAGALTVWDAQDRRRLGLASRVLLVTAGLVLLNLVTWWTQGGNLAWQAHLGGFLAGAGLAAYPRFLANTRS